MYVMNLPYYFIIIMTGLCAFVVTAYVCEVHMCMCIQVDGQLLSTRAEVRHNSPTMGGLHTIFEL